uniref:Uncharacterized protein n=1 Tax=Glossina morsitans morsitans TaxID=37546 RepID=A0A1B0G1P3_GLOMM
MRNFLICIEMFLVAVAHVYSFPHHPFHINSPQYWNNPNHNWCRAFLSMMDISNIQKNASEHLDVVSSSKAMAQANRYGATDNLVSPVFEAEITNASPPRSHLAGAPA